MSFLSYFLSYFQLSLNNLVGTMQMVIGIAIIIIIYFINIYCQVRVRHQVGDGAGS